MTRLRENFVGGIVDTAVDTTAGGSFTLSSPGLATMGVVAAPDVEAIILDPDGLNGAPEIALVTAHTASATTATITAAQEGTAGRSHLVDETWIHCPTKSDFGVGGSSLLGAIQYAPAAHTYSTASATMTAVDAANLTISFVAPSSGSVILKMSATALSSSGAQNAFWGVVTHGTSTVVGVIAEIAQNATAATETVSQLISGLTPGTTYQWDWAFGVTGGATLYLQVGGVTVPTTTNIGPAIMEVYDAAIGGGSVAGSGVLKGDATWTAVTYQNGWVDLAGYAPMTFRKDATGFVHLRGAASGGTAGTLFTLPVGLRPDTKLLFGDTDTTTAVVTVTVNTDGTVVHGNTNQAYVDGITFLASGETGQLHDGGGPGGLLNTLSVGKNSAGQAIPSSAHTALTWDTNVVNTLGAHDTVTNPTRFTAPVAGTYEIGLAVGSSSSPSGTVYTTYGINTEAGGLHMLADRPTSGGNWTATGSEFRTLSANDYVTFYCYVGAALSLAPMDNSNADVRAYMRLVG